MPSSIALPKDSERRKQARLSAQAPVQLRYGRPASTHPATLLDLSWGGALCETPTPLPLPLDDQALWLLLPWEKSETIEIEAGLLRRKDLDNGRHLLAVRFRSLSLFNQTRLEKLLGQLHADRSPNSAHDAPTLVETLEVLIQTLDEWRWALNDIAKGRLRISAPVAFTPGQSIGIRFNGVPARARLRLRARILAGEPIPLHGISVVSSHQLTLEFEHPRNALRQWAEWLMGQIPAAAGASYPADYQPQAARPKAVQARIVMNQSERSALETGFPEALDYLMTAWGDVAAFEQVFRRLIFGDIGIDGTWTPEAWEELQLLQDVHDQAYGLSEARHSRLKAGRHVR